MRYFFLSTLVACAITAACSPYLGQSSAPPPGPVTPLLAEEPAQGPASSLAAQRFDADQKLRAALLTGDLRAIAPAIQHWYDVSHSAPDFAGRPYVPVPSRPGYIYVDGQPHIGPPGYLEAMRRQGLLQPLVAGGPSPTPTPSGAPTPSPTPTPLQPPCNPGTPTTTPPPCTTSGSFHRTGLLIGAEAASATITSNMPSACNCFSGFAYFQVLSVDFTSDIEAGLMETTATVPTLSPKNPNIFQLYASCACSGSYTKFYYHFDGTKPIFLSALLSGQEMIGIAFGNVLECGCRTYDYAAAPLVIPVGPNWERMTTIAQAPYNFNDGEVFGPITWSNNQICVFGLGAPGCNSWSNIAASLRTQVFYQNWPNDPSRLIVEPWPGGADAEVIDIDLHA